MMVDIPEDLILRLEERAEERGCSVEALLRGWLDAGDGEKRRMTLADLAEIAVGAGLRSGEPVDTAERSREILRGEYADYLKQRRGP